MPSQRFVRAFALSVLAGLAMSWSAGARADPTQPARLGKVGDVWPDSIAFKDGEMALALMQTEGGYRLERRRVKIGGSGTDLHRRVAVEPAGEPVALLAGAGLAERSVAAANVPANACFGEATELTGKPTDERRTCQITLGANRIDVVVAARSIETEPNFWKRVFDLTLSHDGASRTLRGVATIVFAGDLDADGRLDLLVDTASHYNVSAEWHLFLSSAAHPGEPLAKVATFTTGGC